MSDSSSFVSGGKLNFNFVSIKILNTDEISCYNSVCKDMVLKIIRYFIWKKMLCDVLEEGEGVKRKRHMMLLCDKIDL